MNLKSLKGIVLGVAVILGVEAIAAYDLSPDRMVVLTRDGQNIVKAFPSSEDCTNWYYLPGSLVAQGKFKSQASHSDVEVGDVNANPGYIYEMFLQAKSVVTNSDLNELRQLLWSRIQNNQANLCAKPGPTSATAIMLSPASVRASSTPLYDRASDRSAGYTGSFHAVYLTEYKGPSTLELATSSREVTLVTDLTHPEAANNLQALVADKEPVTVGSIDMKLDGVMARVQAELIIKAEMKAEFESRMERIKCEETTEEGNKSDAVVDGIILLSSPSAYLAKKLMDGVFPSRSKTTKCTDMLATTFKNGDISGTFEFNTFGTKFVDEDGKPIKVVPCTDRGECEQPIPLEQFLKFELLTLYLQTNFNTIVNTVGKNTFEVTLGRRGKTESKVDVSGKYQRVVYGFAVRSIPVFTQNLDFASFNTRFLKDPFYQCAAGLDPRGGSRLTHYAQQARKYRRFLRTSPMPVADACYSLTNGAGQ